MMASATADHMATSYATMLTAAAGTRRDGQMVMMDNADPTIRFRLDAPGLCCINSRRVMGNVMMVEILARTSDISFLFVVSKNLFARALLA